MIMRLIKIGCVFLLAFPFAVLSKGFSEYSDSYTKCQSNNINDPMSASCIESEIGVQNKGIQEIVSKHHDITSPEDGEAVNLKAYLLQQQKAIDNKCSLWLKAGGQNGELLEKQCVLDEAISLKKLLSHFVSTIDG